MAAFDQRRAFCIEVFVPSHAARRRTPSPAEVGRRDQALARRMASLNNFQRPWSEGCRTSATLQPGVVVLEVTAEIDDDALWASVKRRLSEEAATIGEVVRTFAADPDGESEP
jgi:hypothetical protein